MSCISTEDLNSKSFGENYEIIHHFSCTRFAAWISFENNFEAVDEIVDLIKQLSVALELDKFGWKTELVVKRFTTYLADDDFPNQCTVVFYKILEQ